MRHACVLGKVPSTSLWQVKRYASPAINQLRELASWRALQVLVDQVSHHSEGGRPGRGGSPQAIYTTHAPLYLTQGTRLLGRHRAVGGQVRMDEHLSFYLTGRWLSSAIPGRQTPGRAEHAEERQCSQRGKRRGLATSQLFDAVKSCVELCLLRARISRHVHESAWFFHPMHVPHALCKELCALLRRCAFVCR